MGLKKKALESKVAVIIIFALLVAVVLMFFSKTIFGWIQSILDKLFSF